MRFAKEWFVTSSESALMKLWLCSESAPGPGGQIRFSAGVFGLNRSGGNILQHTCPRSGEYCTLSQPLPWA